MSDRSLFAPLIDEVPRPQVFDEITGAVFVVVYATAKECHIQSVHLSKQKAIQEAEDQALHMRRWRVKFYNPKAEPPEAYLVIPCSAVHVAKV